VDEDIFQATLQCLSKNGINYWWDERCTREILGTKNIKDYLPVNDIIDVWFESGASQRYVLQALNKYPADLYLEGSDQHRGWFQSSMINGFFEKRAAPFKRVKTHGFLVDKLGKKMSKSSGNGLSPSEVIEKYGADVLRLSFLRQITDNDLNWSEGQIKEVEIMYFKIRNTIKFLLQNARKNNGYEKDFSYLEHWVLREMNTIKRVIDIVMDLPGDKKMDLHVIVYHIYQFCDITLSKLYFDIRKDALYWEVDSSPLKKGVQHCLWLTLSHLLRWIAPIIPFAAEEAWQIYKEKADTTSASVHLEKFEEINIDSIPYQSTVLVRSLLELRDMINAHIEPLRASGEIKTTLDAKVIITCTRNLVLIKPEITELLKNMALVSELEIKCADEESKHKKYYEEIILSDDIISISVVPSSGYKCIKCKRRVSQLKEDFCLRCSINQNELYSNAV
jgi:isoleucyl-tRNA synthetase